MQNSHEEHIQNANCILFLILNVFFASIFKLIYLLVSIKKINKLLCTEICGTFFLLRIKLNEKKSEIRNN